MIEQAIETTTREVEVIYWLMETALDEGKTDRARSLFEFLAYLAKYNHKMIKDGLHPPYRERLKEIVHELHGDISIKKHPPVTMKQEISSRKIPFKTEKELSDHLVSHCDLLSDSLGGSGQDYWQRGGT